MATPQDNIIEKLESEIERLKLEIFELKGVKYPRGSSKKLLLNCRSSRVIMMMMETMSNKFGPKLRYCPVCHQVWELELPSNKKIVHKDFPSYGLPRNVCYECKVAYTN